MKIKLPEKDSPELPARMGGEHYIPDGPLMVRDYFGDAMIRERGEREELARTPLRSMGAILLIGVLCGAIGNGDVRRGGAE